MGSEIIPITLTNRMGGVNCYLVRTASGFILIDTGWGNRRPDLKAALERAGCQPGKLRLVVLTHGDFDHTANAAYVRREYDTKVAMDADDAGMVEHGDMFWNRDTGNALIRFVAKVFFGLGKQDRFSPDIILGEGNDLAPYGFDAKVVHLPGHSKGSIGLLTAEGDLFCGDVLTNTDRPAATTLVADHAALAASLEKLHGLEIRTIYPGHGSPFSMAAFAGGGK